MKDEETNNAAIGLHALAWMLADEARAGRFLALTGLTPQLVRERIDQPALLAEVLRYLEAHEPDLLDCAEALSTDPVRLVEARRQLEQPPPRPAAPSLQTMRTRRR